MKMEELIDKCEDADYIWNSILTTGIADKDSAEETSIATRKIPHRPWCS